MKIPKKLITDSEWRPELIGYRIYAEMLLDTMSDGLNKMTVTDVVKILIEQAVEKKFPAVKIKKRRKIFEKLDY
jgi:hypothetical protein